LGPALLETSQSYGNRFKFVIINDWWQTKTAPTKYGTKWLAGVREIVAADGAASFKHIVEDVAFVSQHAVARLLQRGGLTSADDVIAALKKAWPRISIAEAITEKYPREGKSWTIPAVLPNGVRVGLVLAGPEGPWIKDNLSCVTVLTEQMIAQQGRLPEFLELDALMAGRHAQDIFDDRRDVERLLAKLIS